MAMTGEARSRPGLGVGPVALAFDVGGTDTKSAIVDGEGHVWRTRRTATPHSAEHPGPAVIRHVTELAAELHAESPRLRPTCAGLAVPGIVDASRGIGIYSNNLGWRDEPLGDLASSALGLRVSLQHDVTAAGVAEHRLGAAYGLTDAVVVIVGTGIAATLIIDGRPHEGGGYAGEIGHTPVAESPDCVCGGRGCLESIASTAAIARRYAQRSGNVVRGASGVVSRLRAGDDDARIVWEQALDALAFSLAQLTTTLAPEAIVIGGGLSHAGPVLFEPLLSRVATRLPYQRHPKIVPAALGGDAGLLGAALLAREAVAT